MKSKSSLAFLDRVNAEDAVRSATQDDMRVGGLEMKLRREISPGCGQLLASRPGMTWRLGNRVVRDSRKALVCRNIIREIFPATRGNHCERFVVYVNEADDS